VTEQERDNAAYVREVHGKGLAFDLGTMNRRRMLTLIGGAGAAAVVTGTLIGTAGPAAAAQLTEIETETAGPYPADGSNGVDVRTESGIVRSDIRSSFGTSATVAEGVPLVISPRTVAAHVEHIRAKLGVGRRTQIAGWLATVEPSS
jgi:uncharacterized membrane protein